MVFSKYFRTWLLLGCRDWHVGIDIWKLVKLTNKHAWVYSCSVNWALSIWVVSV